MSSNHDRSNILVTGQTLTLTLEHTWPQATLSGPSGLVEQLQLGRTVETDPALTN